MTTALRIAQGRFGRLALLDMDTPLAPHAHSQCHVIFKVSGADSAFYVSEERLPVTDRTAILVNAWEPHYFFSEPDFPRTVYLVLYIEPGWMSSLHSPLHVASHPRFFPHPCVEISSRIRSMVDNLTGGLLSLIPMPQERLESDLFDLMVAVCEDFSAWRHHSQLILPDGRHLQDARIHKAIAYIHQNIGKPLDIAQAAASAHLSRAQFFLRFRRCTGMTPNVFINMLRAEIACKQLAQADGYGSVGRLAQALGFSDQGHFTRFIRGHTGVTPSEYSRVVQVYDAV
ncbi:helix-turn-helix domain-containing protein [Paracandidimonas soli]|uniref:AraC-like DNA-binding protein n=1 Tax=Paracandidimonas soli TaxID=1917182 RepID=A0A4R3VAC0_9BURK|nr:AraC family transcriptional regulator [Paracandidimonas soli]TCV00713.1 AraC-like DNA-binding protein [Paracandidimonas soli]